jgi:hypothetical protein
MLDSECAVRPFGPTREFRKGYSPTNPIRAALRLARNRRILVGLIVEEASGLSTHSTESPM